MKCAGPTSKCVITVHTRPIFISRIRLCSLFWIPQTIMAGLIGLSDELYEWRIVMGLFYQSTRSTQVWNLWYYKSWCTRRYSALMPNPWCQSTSMMRGIGNMWRYVAAWKISICERPIYEYISRNRIMEVVLVICCVYERDWNYMCWMAVDVDLDRKDEWTFLMLLGSGV